MTHDEARALALQAFDEMGDHPEIWKTHGYPSSKKADLIVAIIAKKIFEATK